MNRFYLIFSLMTFSQGYSVLGTHRPWNPALGTPPLDFYQDPVNLMRSQLSSLWKLSSADFKGLVSEKREIDELLKDLNFGAYQNAEDESEMDEYLPITY